MKRETVDHRGVMPAALLPLLAKKCVLVYLLEGRWLSSRHFTGIDLGKL